VGKFGTPERSLSSECGLALLGFYSHAILQVSVRYISNSLKPFLTPDYCRHVLSILSSEVLSIRMLLYSQCTQPGVIPHFVCLSFMHLIIIILSLLSPNILQIFLDAAMKDFGVCEPDVGI
jgi:hypothetical protein